MEGHAGSLATGAGTSATLAATGFNTIAFVVAGFTLLFAGLALLKLVPRPRRVRSHATVSIAAPRPAHPERRRARPHRRVGATPRRRTSNKSPELQADPASHIRPCPQPSPS